MKNLSRQSLTFANHQSGMTLMELLVGMALFSFLALGAISMQKFLIQSQEFSIQSFFTVNNANLSLRTLLTELRNAATAENGAFPLEEANDQQIIFYSNTDEDDQQERVRYFLDGTNFVKGTIDPEGFPVTYPTAKEKITIMAENIQNNTEPIFTYYNQDWPGDTVNNPLATPASLEEVTFVKIKIVVNSDPTAPEKEFILEPAVQIRSLKTNI